MESSKKHTHKYFLITAVNVYNKERIYKIWLTVSFFIFPPFNNHEDNRNIEWIFICFFFPVSIYVMFSFPAERFTRQKCPYFLLLYICKTKNITICVFLYYYSEDICNCIKCNRYIFFIYWNIYIVFRI